MMRRRSKTSVHNLNRRRLCVLAGGVVLLLMALWGQITLLSGLLVSSEEKEENAQIIVPSIKPPDAGMIKPHHPLASTESDPCHGYDGVLRIRRGDKEGAAGTIFFLFVLNQLAFADKHNLLPWIHMTDESPFVFDPLEHGSSSLSLKNDNVTFAMLSGDYQRDDLFFNTTDGCPIPPNFSRSSRFKRITNVTVSGNGVWASYFEPVSAFDPTSVASTSCHSKPLIQLSMPQILKGLHLECLWSVRAWRYGGTSAEVKKMGIPMHEWLGENRQRGAAVVRKYYRPKSSLQHAAQRANNLTEKQRNGCLAVHIRHADKANRRKRIKLNIFYPYIEAYLNATQYQGYVYLATDSSLVMQNIHDTWPVHVSNRIRTQGNAVVRSPNHTAVFKMGQNHHQTNTELLIDILAMAKCQYLVHGLSAVSEAVVFWNLKLHENSVNLEDKRHISVDAFYLRVILQENSNK